MNHDDLLRKFEVLNAASEGIGMSRLSDPMEAYPMVLHEPNRPPRHILTVKDVERLAAAGVKLEFDQIRDQIRPDPVPDTRPIFDASELTRPLVERLRTADRLRNAGSGRYDFDQSVGIMKVQHVSASVHGEKVHVFVHVPGQDPIVFTDDVNLYPSDTLMANIHLLCDQPKQMRDTHTEAQAPKAAVPHGGTQRIVRYDTRRQNKI